jgi:hypothetical protein
VAHVSPCAGASQAQLGLTVLPFSGISTFDGLPGGNTTFAAGDGGGSAFVGSGTGNRADFSAASAGVQADLGAGTVTVPGGADTVSGLTAVTGSSAGHNTFVAGAGSETFSDPGATGLDTVDFTNVATSALSVLNVNVSGVPVNTVASGTAAVGATTYTFTSAAANFTTFDGSAAGHTDFFAGPTGGYTFNGAGSGNTLDLSAAPPGTTVSLTGPDSGTVTGLTGGQPDLFAGIENFIGFAPAAPTVTGVSPNSGATTGGTSVDIVGTDLAGATEVAFGGTTTGFTVDSATHITATAPPHAAGTIDVAVTTAAGTSSPSGADQFTFVPPSVYTAVNSYRVCDTRGANGLVGTNAQCAGQRLAAGGTLTIDVAGTNPSGTAVGGVPASGVTAVVLNVTAAGEASQGFLTVWPSDVSRPNASSLNYRANKTVPNLVTVGLSATGQVSFYSLQATDVVVDVEGYYAAPSGTAGLFNALTPYRICDTRGANGLVDTNAQCAGHTLSGGQTLTLQVTGTNPSGTSSGGLPGSGVSSVVLNVTAIGHGQGFLTVFPQGFSAPTASNLNFSSGQVVPNRVIVPVSATGQVSITTNTSVDVVVDVNGWFTDGASLSQTGARFVATSPSRICDTRNNGNATPCAGHTIAGGTHYDVAVAGQGPVPASGVVAVVGNLTATDTTAQSFLTAWPTGQLRPNVSDLNWVSGLTVPNMAVIELGTGGDVSVFVNSGSADVIVDVTGWYLGDS